MAAILQTTFSNTFLLNQMFCISIKIPLKFVSEGPVSEWLSLTAFLG